MIPIKALLTGLVGVSLCMANIGGIVTDTGSTPISGATVQLEKGGQTATTGADGSFTLVTSTAILPGKGKLMPNGLSAGISGNLMTLTIGERSTVEIATFDLNGKALSMMRKTMDAGRNSITLPQRSAGVYLYKVKSGNGELLFKGNSVGGASVSIVSSQDPALNRLAKQAKTMAAINDVITVTKDGLLIYRVVVYNSDTSGIAIKMIASAGTVTDADGNVYQTVKFGNQVWMAENLRVTRFNDGSAIRNIPIGDTTNNLNQIWGNLTTPGYCYYNIKFGAFYNWYAVDTKKLAPIGWHVPSDSEWTILQTYMVLNGYNWGGIRDTSKQNRIAKSLAAKTDWVTYTEYSGTVGNDLTKNNSSGFSALPGGYRGLDGVLREQGNYGYWWSATDAAAEGAPAYAWDRYLHNEDNYLSSTFDYHCSGVSVRLVKDN
jgi:uncharacterized protein (TIGR02145 family)